MTPMTVRGLPRGLQKDAWWMAADAQSGVGQGTNPAIPRPYVILIALVILVDVLTLRAGLGLGLVVMIATLGAAAHWTVRHDVDRKRGIQAWCVLGLSLIPAIDLVQFTSFLLAWIGLTVFAVMLTGDKIWTAAMRLPFLGMVQTWSDVASARVNGVNRSTVLDWVLPVGVGAIFAMLFAFANPIMTAWIADLDFRNAPSIERIIAWIITALIIWPLLRLPLMRLHGPKARARTQVRRAGIMNVRSVMRGLIVFNVLFALQTIMDIGYLWGGVRLPEGMTYATYAHRGAYPLMGTALLAGGFALIAQPWLDGRMMRVLLLIWVGQTLLLVMSSILRLDLYVDAYGLTRMRFAAFVWMAAVALGLIVLIMQILRRHDARWMLARSFGIGVVAVYACSLVNVAGYVARHQFTQGPLDVSYVCNLNGGAAPTIAQYGPDLCWNRYHQPTLSKPTDLRDWGFRNARLRHTLAAITAKAGS